ncbi:MAG: DUF362 domain-containing protein [Candidatus Omnitrophota bacterium]
MKNFEVIFHNLLKCKISRKKFLKTGIFSLILLSKGNPFADILKAFAKEEISSGRVKSSTKGAHDLVVAKGQYPYIMTKEAIKAMGGMAKFVKKGSVVLIKPNIGWDRSVEQAANTNPEVVAALIDLSHEAGAKRVNVFDASCNDAKRCYANSGVQQKAKEHGANIFFPSSWNVVMAKFAHTSPMENWPVYREALECDTFINVPILKHHGLTGLTLSMKNLMGVCSGNRGQIHYGIGKKLVDITGFINPDLTVIDAYRVLLRHGPQGGDLADVALKNTVIVGTDPTLSDAFACTLMDVDPLSVSYIQEASQRGFGSIDLAKADILHINT